jgi:hypothetical protein
MSNPPVIGIICRPKRDKRLYVFPRLIFPADGLFQDFAEMFYIGGREAFEFILAIVAGLS